VGHPFGAWVAWRFVPDIPYRREKRRHPSPRALRGFSSFVEPLLPGKPCAVSRNRRAPDGVDNQPDRKRLGSDLCNAMNYTPRHRFFPGGLRRGGLLAVVLALHGVAFAAFLTVGTTKPELPETPLMVRFIDPPKPVEVAPPIAQSLPAAAPEPPAAAPAPKPPPPDPPKPKAAPKPVPKPKPAPKPKPVPRPVPPLETTHSSESAPAETAIMVAADPAPPPTPTPAPAK
jgi:hypothetical protein